MRDYDALFDLIEKWVGENPEYKIGVAMSALIEVAQEKPEHTKNCYDAIRAMSRGIENWPICRCGRIHNEGE